MKWFDTSHFLFAQKGHGTTILETNFVTSRVNKNNGGQ